ncbi:hypothetical protein [Tsuneonella sp. HG222]
MSSHNLSQLKEETIAAVAGLFVVNGEAIKSYEKGTYFTLFALGSKRVRSILGAEREVLIIGNTFHDQQPRSIQFAHKLIEESDGRLERSICIIVHQDARGNNKLKNWGRERGLIVIPIYTSSGILPRGQELERQLSYEFFTQDPFDITGPVANDSQFFGRRNEALEIERKQSQGHIRACFGIRKIGKTSILHRILGEIKENYDCPTIFVDCQRDDVFNLNAAGLIWSISQSLESLRATGKPYIEVEAAEYDGDLSVAAAALQRSFVSFEKPVILAFDEIDYITPGNAACPQWRHGFVEFWRNVRAAYHAAAREDRIVSLLVSGVSSRWFAVESIDNVENAALAFVPEEYLSPLPRGAAEAMIKNIGSMAGLKFDEVALSTICSYCSDMPFWIRKACSFIHARVETAARPLLLSKEQVLPLLEAYVKDQGGPLALVALQHLFRVYPELREPAQSLLNPELPTSPRAVRILGRYGITSPEGKISGVMIEQALKLLAEGDLFGQPLSELSEVSLDFDTRMPISEWAEELAGISMRRNLLERSLRSFTVNFLRAEALTKKSTAKAMLLSALNETRRRELDAYNVEAISSSLT